MKNTLLLALLMTSSQVAMAAALTTPGELEVPHKTIKNLVIETKSISDIIQSLNTSTELVKEENALNWSASLEEGQINDSARKTSNE
jgi:hypothetical protein